MWVENGPMKTAQAQHLEHTTTRWATCYVSILFYFVSESATQKLGSTGYVL